MLESTLDNSHYQGTLKNIELGTENIGGLWNCDVGGTCVHVTRL